MLPNDVFFFKSRICRWQNYNLKKKINEVLFYLGHLCDETILRFWSGIIGSFWWGKLIKHFWIGEFCPRRETVLQVPLDCSDWTRKISYNFWARPFNLIWSRAVIKEHSIPTPEEIRSAIALRYVRGQRLAISEGFWCSLQLTDNCKNWYVSATGYTGMKQTASPSARRDSHPEGEGVKDGAMIWPTLGRDSVPLNRNLKRW